MRENFEDVNFSSTTINIQTPLSTYRITLIQTTISGVIKILITKSQCVKDVKLTVDRTVSKMGLLPFIQIRVEGVRGVLKDQLPL